jgi:hypothetical protein
MFIKIFIYVFIIVISFPSYYQLLNIFGRKRNFLRVDLHLQSHSVSLRFQRVVLLQLSDKVIRKAE